MVLYVVLLTLGVLLLVEGLFIFLFPKETKNITSKMFRNSAAIRKVALIELLIGAVLLFLGLGLRI